ncbi:MAG: hypothetical protein DMG97_37790 [Acidobacteria bacterium]|nr:MAG: hypothetical protein DMG97_37790 [Acidobacteriota bacterium]
MAVQTKKGWQDLCRAASTEKDPEKLLRLVSQINSLLLNDEKKRSQGEGRRDTDSPRNASHG